MTLYIAIAVVVVFVGIYFGVKREEDAQFRQQQAVRK